MSAEPIAAHDTGVYYSGSYWNDIPAVRAELNRRATGSPDTDWMHYLLRQHGGPFRRFLSLNCGNGWVERDLLRRGVAASGVGIDYAESLLAEARLAAAAANLPLDYHQADTNRYGFALDGIDLVVNHAAGHHIAYLDRVFRSICALLPTDGVFVSWDYVGPHRNQYPASQWEAIHAANRDLPAALRKTLRYPHLKSMLAGDPTEAIHSELILPVMRRYFSLDEVHFLGGTIAYELLSSNPAFHQAIRPDREIDELMALDLAALGDDPEANSLFAFVIARPRKEALDDHEQLARWTQEEEAREEQARADGGRYFPVGMLEHLYDVQYSLEAAVATGRPPVIDGEPAPSFPRFVLGRWYRRSRRLAGRVVRAVRTTLRRP